MAGARESLQAMNLVVRFLLEIAALIALGYAGAQATPSVALGAGLAIIAPLLMILVWGLFVSPKAPRRLPDPARAAVEVVLFATASAALVGVGAPALGGALAAAYAVHLALMFAWGQRGR